MKLLVLCISMVAFTAASEKVWLRELNTGSDRRGLESSSLEFELRRPSGHTKLQLRENRKINANAPVYELRTDNQGKQRLVKQKGTPKMTTKFYHDKRNAGSFQVKMDKTENRPLLSGNLRLNDDFFDISTVPTMFSPPKTSRDMPYVLKQSTHNGENKARENNVQDEQVVELNDDSKADSKIPNLIARIRQLLDTERKMQRSKRSSPVYAVEILVVVDPTVWTRFSEITTASGGLTQDQATELRLREHFVHRVNGMSLRYESIDDPDMNIYLTVSGFLFYKEFNTSNPLPPDTTIIESDGKLLVNASLYLSEIRDWATGLSDTPHNDHVMVFTDYDLYTASGNSVAGMAYVGATCSGARVSINEDGDYFRTVSVAAHELGHNLGANHDTSSACTPQDKFVMAPSVANFGADEAYTPNPWTFSQCSIESFKTYISSLGGDNCLLDTGDYFSEAEYNAHLETLPGQLHTAQDQCKLERGSTSYLCTGLTPTTASDFCRRMSCYEPSNGYCYFYTPARGTDCGADGDDTYCINGQCVQKSDEHSQQSKEGVTGQTPADATSATDNADTSGSDGSNTGGDGGDTPGGGDTGSDSGGDAGTCVDTGYQGYSCTYLDNYFITNYNAGPDMWCLDPQWEARCCAYCRGERPATTTTTTPAPGSCVNLGWTEYNYSCDEVSQLFLDQQGIPPSYWCRDPKWKDRCCALCAANGV